MPENKHLRVLLGLFYGALALAGLWAAAHILLPWLAPFLAAVALAALLEPAVSFLTVHPGLPRWGASALCTTGLAGAALGLLGLGLWRLLYEAGILLGRLPALLAGLPTLSRRLESWAYRFLIALPVQLREFAQTSLEELLQQGIALPNRVYDLLAALASGLIGGFPRALLFLFTTLLATYFTSARWPQLKEGLRRLTPEQWREPLRRGRQAAARTLGNWLRAQGVLMLITFGELAAGLLLLRVDLFLLLAALIALVDALPVFGTGAVLLPWAAAALLAGNTGQGLGLAALYGVVTLVRNLLEPKLVGKGMDLPPLAALIAMYVGFQSLGVAGMILAPLGTALACQLWRAFRR